MKKFITINEAIEELVGLVNDLKVEKVSLSKSLHRVTGEAIFTQTDMPNFRKSPFDGYAVKSASTKGASLNNQISLSVTMASTFLRLMRKARKNLIL